MNAILCGGGTAGHITPAIAIYDTLKEQGHSVEIIVSTKDASLIPERYNFKMINLTSPGNFVKKIKFILGFPFALIKSYKYIKEVSPNFIIGMGGYVSLPVLIIGLMMRIKIFLCEQNSVPGKTNKLIYKFATMTYLTFNKSLEYMPNGKVFGNPVRKEFFITTRESARMTLEIKENDNFLLVMGGSQGALKLNELFLSSIKKIQSSVENLHIVWLTGSKWYEDISKKLDSMHIKNIKVYSYYQDMPTLLHAADFVVSRAGSSSISEIMAVTLPSLLIPFPHATDNHQYFNARELLDKDMAYLVQESVLDKTKLENIIISALNDKKRLNVIKENIKKANVRNSALFIVNDIINILK